MTTFLHSVAACTFSASLVLAQGDLSPRQFIPVQIEGYYIVELEAMRDSGVWDGLLGGFGAVLLEQVEQSLGLSLREIHRIEGYAASAAGGSGPAQLVQDIQILRGSAELDVPNGREGTEPVRIAGREALFEAPSEWALPGDQGWLWLRLGEGTMVSGARGLVEPVMKGLAKPGVTPPELMSLSAGRGVIAHCTGFVRAGDSVSGMVLFDAPSLEGVPAPRSASLRLRLDESKVEDEWDDPSVVIEATVRWEKKGDSAARVVASVQQKIAEWRKHPRFGALRSIFDKVELSSDGIDAKLSLDLGRPRQAATMIGLAAPFLMFTVPEPVMEIEEIELEAVEVAEPLPPPPPVEPSPNGGGR